jgi:hypothetical protein
MMGEKKIREIRAVYSNLYRKGYASKGEYEESKGRKI